jgi:hypothetical protein
MPQTISRAELFELRAKQARPYRMDMLNDQTLMPLTRAIAALEVRCVELRIRYEAETNPGRAQLLHAKLQALYQAMKLANEAY